MNSFAFIKKNKSRGFTLVELLIVLAIIAVLAILAIMNFRTFIIGGKVEPTASDVNKVIAKLRGAYAGQGNTPYAAINTAVFANAARGAVTSLNINGAGAAATIQHELGATGSEVVVAPAAVTAAGDSFTITFNTVNAAACPGLAAQLSRVSDGISINGVNVKPAGVYLGTTAATACAENDTNTFQFLTR